MRSIQAHSECQRDPIYPGTSGVRAGDGEGKNFINYLDQGSHPNTQCTSQVKNQKGTGASWGLCVLCDGRAATQLQPTAVRGLGLPEVLNV